jgi:hypothetical protein
MARAAYAHYWAEPPTLDRHVEAIVALYRGLIPPSAAARLRA